MTTVRPHIQGARAIPRTTATYPGGTNTSNEAIDWIAVERTVDGDQLPLNPAERYTAARILHDTDHTGLAIAALVGASDRTITRWTTAGYPTRRPLEGTPVTVNKTTLGASVDDWRHQAACRQEDSELFFPIGNTGPALLQIEEAKAVCGSCPVLQQCAQWALETREPHGVWGGMSEDDRRRILRRAIRNKPKQRQDSAVCGTRSGYKRHRNEHTTICEPCRAANTAYGNQRYHNTKQAAA